MTRIPFIVFEGIDGSGKTEISKMLLEFLSKRDLPVLWTGEPSDGAIGQFIRQVIRGEITHIHPDAETMALLFMADRSDHVKRHIEPFRNDGTIIICDRYSFSTFVYQSIKREFENKVGVEQYRNWLDTLSAWFPIPDVVIVFDLDVETAMSRIAPRNVTRDIYEREAVLREARTRYLDETVRFAYEHKESEIFLVDTNHSTIDQVFKSVCDLLARSRVAMQLGM